MELEVMIRYRVTSESLSPNRGHADPPGTCLKSYPFVQFKFSVYGLTYVPDIHVHASTRTCVLQCSHANVGLAQARPKKQATKVTYHAQ